MATLRIEFQTSKKLADGRHPVNIICSSGNYPVGRYNLTSAYPHEWDEKNERIKARSRKDYAKTNMHIETEFNKYETRFLEIKKQYKKFKPSIVFDDLPVKVLTVEHSFFDISNLYLEKVAQQSGFSHDTCKNHIDKFSKWLGNSDFMLTDFTPKLLQDYVTYLKNKGNINNTICNNIKTLRSVSSHAKKNQIAEKSEALHAFTLPKRTKPVKKKLNADQLEAFANVETHGRMIRACKQSFLLAIYLRGMRISDVLQLKPEHFQNGSLVYTMQKVEKTHDIQILPEAQAIIDEYKDAGTPYLLPFLKWEYDPKLSIAQNNELKKDAIKTATAFINKRLKILATRAGIPIKVSTHLARHTFGKKAIDTIKDFFVTMDLMGHTSISDHQSYIRELNQKDTLDNAADAIFRKKPQAEDHH